MKRLFKNVLLVLLLALGFIFGSLDVYAEASDTSKWNTDAIEKLTTSDGIEITYDLSKVKVSYYIKGEITVNVIIPADYDKEEIVIAPEVFQQVSRAIQEAFEDDSLDEEYLQFRNPFQAGDSLRVKLVINNLSKYEYNYEETSFEVFPTEPLVYKEKDSSVEETDNTLFNQIKVPAGFTFRRAYNTALQALIPNSSGRYMTDEAIDEALKTNGYAGIGEYDKYLLDFYNDKYSTSYTRLDQFNKGIIREILSSVDPLYVLNNAYRKGLNLTFLSGNQERAKKELDEALREHGYNSPIEFILDYYKVSSIADLTDEMINELYASNGNEEGSLNTETNGTIIALAYNFFYNEGLGFYFDQKNDNGNYTDNKDLKNADYTGGDYSIGSYMRDKTKGDEDILERAGTLKANSENTISGVLKNIGAYTPNAYLSFNFMVNLQLKYKAKTGNLIIKYVDREGNELLSDVTSTEMVGKKYQTNPEDIKNYKLFDVDGVESGEYIDGTIVVVYIYDKVGSEETGEITPPNTGVSTTNSGLLILSLLVVNGLGASVVLRKNN